MKRLRWSALVIVVGLCVIADLLVSHEGAAWYLVPGFYSIFGFAGTLLITYFAKSVGRIFLQKKEDYYNAR